jgi:hypothetical protein
VSFLVDHSGEEAFRRCRHIGMTARIAQIRTFMKEV